MDSNHTTTSHHLNVSELINQKRTLYFGETIQKFTSEVNIALLSHISSIDFKPQQTTWVTLHLQSSPVISIETGSSGSISYSIEINGPKIPTQKFQKILIEALEYMLKKNGLVCIGESESVIGWEISW